MFRRFGKLPPLSSLRGFEAAARLGSFSKAAEELNMTQSAISHQIRVLEEFLGQPLFSRNNRHVDLTDAGIDFLQTVAKSLGLLADGVNRLEFYKKPGSVIIATNSSLGSKWLIPRLPKLKDSYPDVDPWIFPYQDPIDLTHAEIDFVIWFGDGEWPGATVEKLFDDYVTPFYSPALVRKHGIPQTPADLVNLPLLHDERREDWRAWFSAAGVEHADTVSGVNFGDFGMSLDAALAGQGVVLGNVSLAAPHVEKGDLVQPFSTLLPTSDAFYLAYLPQHFSRPPVEQFYKWLTAEVTGTNS